MADPDILFEDADVLVVNKPAGLVVHPDGRTDEPTLVDWILKRYPDLGSVGEPLKVKSIKSPTSSSLEQSEDDTHKTFLRPGIVHRLDRETSGALIIAKNQESYLYLKRQFQDREVKKKYHAFVWGKMRDERGTIRKPIGRSPRDFRQYSATRGATGEMREAVTWFRVLAHKDGFSFIEAQPQTGRTHQIRVHMKSTGHPIVSDALYSEKRPQALGFIRTALHSREISFTLRGGKAVTVIAPYPEDFKKVMGQWGLETE